MITLTPTTLWDIDIHMDKISKITLTDEEGSRSALTFHFSNGATLELAVTRQDSET